MGSRASSFFSFSFRMETSGFASPGPALSTSPLPSNGRAHSRHLLNVCGREEERKGGRGEKWEMQGGTARKDKADVVSALREPPSGEAATKPLATPLRGLL